ncbi:unnamed protein product [Porites lobata]|uniref:Uncharacterized protein n=1 Tax=Porites lobata TaxID=104759 RepID=A0ABN8QK01_9CNID|nr:unnamed protein product [Porites lobata]
MKNPPKRPQHNPSTLDTLAGKKKTDQTAFECHIRATLPSEPFFHFLDFDPLSGQLKVSWYRCLSCYESSVTCVITQPLSGQLKVSWYRRLSCYESSVTCVITQPLSGQLKDLEEVPKGLASRRLGVEAEY